MISAGQLSQRREQATRVVEEAFPTTITILGRIVPAARWTGVSGANAELAGLLPTFDLAIRVRRSLLAGLDIVAERTVLEEDGRRYRVKKVRDARGDPAVVLECEAA